MYNETTIEVLLFRFHDSQLVLNSRLIINNIYSALSLNTAYFMFSNIATISPGLLYQIDTKNSHLQYQIIKSGDSLNYVSHIKCKCGNGRIGKTLYIQTGEKAAGTSGPRSGLRLPLKRLVFIFTRYFHSVQNLGLSSRNNR